MQSKIFIGFVIAVFVILGAVALNNRLGGTAGNDRTAVQSVVSGFGSSLAKVSVLSPAAAQEIKDAYGSYVSKDLLAAWQNAPQRAPGRAVSSPWPERIDVASLEENADGSYSVHGSVIEVTSGEAAQGGAADSYPVILTVSKQAEGWRITSYERGAPLPSGDVTIVGTSECLPHRNTSGPQTLECAIGLLEDGSGRHYALDLQDVDETSLTDVGGGLHIAVAGLLVPIEQINSDAWQKYNVSGIIKVKRAVLADTSAGSETASTTIITQDDNNGAVHVKVGDRFLLKLGEMEWSLNLSNQDVVSRVKNVMVVRGAQGLYTADKPGTVVLSAEGRPICNPGEMCAQYIVSFKVTIDVSKR